MSYSCNVIPYEIRAEATVGNVAWDSSRESQARQTNDLLTAANVDMGRILYRKPKYDKASTLTLHIKSVAALTLARTNQGFCCDMAGRETPA
eukprot:581402-Karenia_brevis.AAC.1